MTRRRGVLLAGALSVAAIAARELEFADVRYDRFHLPAFDGHVYVAMAERPAFFTVAPWGYRVLTPWLVSLLPLAHASAFFWMTAGALALGGVLLFLYLRRLGHAGLPALLGLAVFGASGPVGESVRYQFLVEPLTLCLEMALLLALESGAGVAVLALVAVLGALAKESFVLLLPLVYLARRRREGDARALVSATVVALPTLAVTLLLRGFWTPHLHPPLPALGTATLSLALDRVRESWPEWWQAALLMGLTPLALLGALRGRARYLAPRCAYLFLVTIASPFLNPVAFFAEDIHRLLLYALPAVLPLSLLALDRVWPHAGEPAPPVPLRSAWRWTAAGLTAGLVVLPLAVVDRYRRVDLQGTRDALLVLAVCRETLRTATALDDGEPFVFDSRLGRFSEGVTSAANLGQLRRVRWFLRDGWGALAQREGGDAVMQGREASLVVPCLQPRDLEVQLAFDAAAETRLGVRVNGKPVADLLVGAGRAESVLRLPANLLFRGDNILSLVAAGPQGPRVRLLGFTLRATRG